jgi:putative redox protein
MEVNVSHLGRSRFSIQSRSHTVFCDQPVDNGGDDTGMTPPEMLLASLGSCAAFYAVQYLKTRNLAQSGVEVHVTAEKLAQPPRIGNFRIRVVSPVALTEEQNLALMRSVQHCTVHNTFLTPPKIEIQLEVPAVSGACG